MKKVLLTLLISFSLIGCKLQTGKIILDQNTHYVVPAEYKLTQLSQIDVDVYSSLFNKNSKVSIVLYKTMTGKGNKLFLGIGFETDASIIKNEILEDNRNQILSIDSIPDKSFTIYLKRDSFTYIVHHLRTFSSGNKYLFTCVNNEEIVDSLFIEKYIDNQIIEK